MPAPLSLDAPPPSPALQGVGTGASPAPPPTGFGGLAPQGAPGVTPEVTQQVLQMGDSIDKALIALAQMMPAGAAEFRQAQQFIQLGFAKSLQAGAAATSPTSVGAQFPGGGFGGGGFGGGGM
jgi:hypothetical protein